MSNPSTEFLEFPETTALQSGRTYVIRKDHILNSTNSTIPINVTLYFMGGILSPSNTGIQLIGNKTRIIAPIEQIFSTNLAVGGSWCIDRAYPQWFGAKEYPNSDIPNHIDNSDAINKAIEMKQTGEVFLPRGRYVIKKTIFVRCGIQLIGEAGILGNSETDATILLARTDTAPIPPEERPRVENTLFTKEYFVMVNVKHNGYTIPDNKIDWEIGYPPPGTVIKQIIFRNDSKISRLKCILSLDNLELFSCVWYYFQQAIACGYGEHYIDMKRIVRCMFNDPGDFHRGEVLYAFDIGFLGDAFVFENNSINQGGYNHGIKMIACNGGNITSNIINADVYIEDSKGIVFESNHMEVGAQVIVDTSNVNLLNNFIHKGNRPSLIIKSSGNDDTPVVMSSGNMFMFYEQPTSDPNDRKVAEICEYDIQTDGTVTLQLTQTYRYTVASGSIGKMYTCGIAICNSNMIDGKEVLSPISLFNDYSYLLSSFSRIMLGMNIVNTSYINGISVPFSGVYKVSEFCTWTKDSGTYCYKSSMIWDLKRKIISNTRDLGNYELTKKGGGLLMGIGQGKVNGSQAMTRIYRGINNTYSEYVDVPVCGSNYFFDNGTSICGFRWKPLLEGIITGNTMIESIAYRGENVECKGTSCPTTGIWQKGDIVYNTDPNTANSMWIYLGSSGWKAR